MKISAKDEYACAAVLELSLNYGNEMPVQVHDIAERHAIPMKFLFQIMQSLKRVDIVRSKRGTDGGYVLGRHPGTITIGDVIRGVSGPLVQLSNPDSQFKPVWAELDRAIGGVLNNTTFEELAQRSRANRPQVMYHI